MADDTDAGIPGTILDAAGLLVREARHWLPIVAVLSMIAALPEAVIEHYMPDLGSLLQTLLKVDVQAIVDGLVVALLLFAMKLLIELVALMFAFVILADLSAGRTPDIAGGMRRLASWRLQFAWLVAGIFEQAAISGWYAGGTLLLLPVGLATTVAYEEDNGFQSFPRAFHLGLLEMGPARPGIRIAAAVTVGFVVGAVVSLLISVVSCAGSAAVSAPAYLDMYTALQAGHTPDLATLGSSESGSSWAPAVFDVLLAPINILPSVYMITVQQMTYWQARRFEAAGNSTGSPK